MLTIVNVLLQTTYLYLNLLTCVKNGSVNEHNNRKIRG